MLAPGGKMLMVTCSIWPAESEAQAAAFAARHGAIRLDAPGQLLPTMANPSDANNEHDGLFYALFQKPGKANGKHELQVIIGATIFIS
jgi:16S rRNA (cytosine967-C5)-methyltransferase